MVKIQELVSKLANSLNNNNRISNQKILNPISNKSKTQINSNNKINLQNKNLQSKNLQNKKNQKKRRNLDYFEKTFYLTLFILYSDNALNYGPNHKPKFTV